MNRLFSPRFFVCTLLLVPAACFAFSTLTELQAENWPRFRGINGAGISSEKGFPLTWTDKDYAWKKELPGLGHSSPSIWDDNLFVTSALGEGETRYLFCIDPKTGKEKWRRETNLKKSHKHRKGSWASSTPATDGEFVFVEFADEESYLLIAYDMKGNKIWERDLGAFTSQHGHGSSPMIYNDLVIATKDQKGPSVVTAFNKRTGKTVWQADRAERRTSYATPIVINHPNTDPQLICVSGATGISSLVPETGKVNWTTGEFPMRTVSSPVYGEGLIFATCGGGGRGKLLYGVDPTGSGNIKETHIKYTRSTKLPYVPTPIVYEGHLYLWGDNGVVSCIDLATQKNIWTERIDGGYSSSPVCIDGILFCINEDGEVAMVNASPQFKSHGKVKLSDPSHATVVVANGQMFLRTFRNLYCLNAKK
ncbi:PQQ-binding-like beta-propeller repeat protein [Gimesia aquarii]|uniref:Outer membrane biogenesis protein BamB n=1 Tax=Gimesia aquarii TaxID=2527964 RepID=A0A517X249_9PLAN|nr:PQQ-binding-like beta-propeller repeat protein [Gimesia aquarii]QDU11583.1 outer membrane biogenesis protein BamB [Gimesia aquarii]